MNEHPPLLLVTGAAGKVGQHFLRTFLDDDLYRDWQVRVLCHQRLLEATDRVDVVQGDISDQAVVKKLLVGVTHVLHLATCKESPDTIIDVAVKGMFWVLEECRQSPTFQQFILLGGDASMGHFVYPHPVPVTETQPHSAYPGCYALSKVLEEVLLEQYIVQYELNGCCLRAPWIMEKDDFKYQLSFGDDVFGGPRWRDLVGAEEADRLQAEGAAPIMLDSDSVPVQRNFVHVHDLVEAVLCALDHPEAFGQTFNICMDEPVDYGKMAAWLNETRGLPSVGIITPYHSTWLDNAKAKFLLGWRPEYDMHRLVDEAFDYERAPDDPRKIWYPG
ncbi:NAD-dependent epimerase/dehydratase family protein [Lignipirellula cremea]|uniref:dTDP-glucose 4,6-dehydratase n=1 Tax=Lignipirellula cremea TaxID=2528010 RepID=A0A518E1V9_9BACT|nr:NAD(P)-dependent oxidoreductase [Lignipirellula cremea]QDU98064.1 dTDP-glucose 4,6-dehydratase [Lignipirellula cremea]